MNVSIISLAAISLAIFSAPAATQQLTVSCAPDITAPATLQPNPTPSPNPTSRMKTASFAVGSNLIVCDSAGTFVAVYLYDIYLSIIEEVLTEDQNYNKQDVRTSYTLNYDYYVHTTNTISYITFRAKDRNGEDLFFIHDDVPSSPCTYGPPRPHHFINDNIDRNYFDQIVSIVLSVGRAGGEPKGC